MQQSLGLVNAVTYLPEGLVRVMQRCRPVISINIICVCIFSEDLQLTSLLVSWVSRCVGWCVATQPDIGCNKPPTDH